MRLRTLFATVCLLPTLSAPLAAQDMVVDHSLFNRVLQQHVRNGRVDYDGVTKDSAFARYLVSLERVDPSLLSSGERVAFWINVYNAFTIGLIIDNGERNSIRNINRTMGVLKLKGPWVDPFVRAGGRTLTLDEVHHRMIRRESSDPRIHFALSCAAVSCPPLRDEAYTGAQLEQQLHDQGRRFLNDSTYNFLDVKRRTFHHSIVFRNFREDFGNSREELGNFLAQWYTDSAAKRVLTQGAFRMSTLPFDWSLNAIDTLATAAAESSRYDTMVRR